MLWLANNLPTRLGTSRWMWSDLVSFKGVEQLYGPCNPQPSSKHLHHVLTHIHFGLHSQIYSDLSCTGNTAVDVVSPFVQDGTNGSSKC